MKSCCRPIASAAWWEIAAGDRPEFILAPQPGPGDLEGKQGEPAKKTSNEKQSNKAPAGAGAAPPIKNCCRAPPWLGRGG